MSGETLEKILFGGIFMCMSNGNSCGNIWWIIILVLLFSCGGCGGGCGNDCGCGNSNNNNGGCGCY